MHWRQKALTHRLVSAVPGGRRLGYLLQRFVTRGVPRSPSRFASAVRRTAQHADALQRAGVELSSARAFEFGAGWDLLNPLALTCFGLRHQLVVDLTEHTRRTLVDDTLRRLAEGWRELGLPGPPPPASGETLGDRLGSLGLDYRAPFDARRTGLPPASVDVVTSTSTMEHIPPDDLRTIVGECYRVLRPGGLASFIIDYGDHYSYTDSTIGPYNFLRFTADEWARYNPASHFQSRSRHPDYVRLFDEAGFTTDEVVTEEPTADGLRSLDGLAVSRDFDRYGRDDIAITGARFLLRR